MTEAEARWRAERTQQLLAESLERFAAMAQVRMEARAAPWDTIKTIAATADPARAGSTFQGKIMDNEKYDTAAAGLTLAAIDGAQMMIESLRKDREYVSTALAAARQEIASLRAQHEGGKSEALADLAYAHGMTTGWNLCIADKHDEFARIRSMRSSQAISTIEAPQPAAQVQDDQWKTPTTVLQRAGDTLQLLCAGQRPPDVIITDWLDNSSEELQAWCCQYGPSWCQGIAVIDAAMLMVDQPTEIVTPESNADHEHRTSPQPAAQAALAGMEPVALLKFAVWDDGELRLLSGRKGPAFDCELYAMPDGKRAPDLFTAAQVQAMLAAAPAPPLTHTGDKP